MSRALLWSFHSKFLQYSKLPRNAPSQARGLLQVILETEQLTATVSPDNVTDKSVTWSVSSQSGSNIATVSYIGVVTAVNPGTAVIRATSNANTTKYSECSVTVNAVDKTALTTIITNAKALLASIPIGTAVGDASQEAHDAYNTAITSATVVENNASATQAEIDAALTALATATTAFNNAIILMGSKTTLTTAITNAKVLLANIPIGTAVGHVSQETHDAYSTAITSATVVENNANATRTEFDAAVTDLAAATTIFNNAIILVGDKTELTTAITKATTLLASVPIGTEVGNVSQAAHNAYNTAITSATVVKNNANENQTEIDAAVK